MTERRTLYVHMTHCAQYEFAMLMMRMGLLLEVGVVPKQAKQVKGGAA